MHILFLYGGYYPRSGAQKFAENLKEIIERNDERVLVKHRVDKIVVENNEVKGVVVEGKVFKSRIVVANANAKAGKLSRLSSERGSGVREEEERVR